ncbi:MAG: NAD(P)-dependent oxidoreductase [Fluviicola sp.]|nr:NAD(P)-dependent oxidoreductase [Fluviicola sp.]
MESNHPKTSIALIGGGASALFFAASIDSSKFSVTIYEKNKTLGRKFLVAGDGGFNLTHSEPTQQMIARYSPNDFLQDALLQFDNNSCREWLSDLGIATFIGSSKRIYPEKGIKPIEVLNAILQKIKENKVEIKYEQTWNGWKDDKLLFNSSDVVVADIVIFALGGASWKVTGSDGSWLRYFEEKGIETLPFQASNCAYKVDWKSDFIKQFHGEPLKNISATCENKTQKGELVITEFGLEGNAIYALSPEIRRQLNNNKDASLFIDLKPHLSAENLKIKFENASNSSKNRTSILREKIKLSKTQVALLKSILSKDEFLDDAILLQKIKQLPIKITDLAPMDEAISTVGGIVLSEVSESFEIKKLPRYYCIGEMLDYDAPTGGYLLQACYSLARIVAKKITDSL